MRINRREIIGFFFSFTFVGCVALVAAPPLVAVMYKLLKINEKEKTVTFDSIERAVDYQVETIVKIKRNKGKNISPNQIKKMKESFIKLYEEELKNKYKIIY